MKKSSQLDPAGIVAGKRILVTGATGFIGGRLARRLTADGAHVIALEHSPGKGDPLRSEGIEVVHGDFADAGRMRHILSQDIQIVMHIAAWLRGRPYSNYKRLNLDGTQQLAQICAELHVERFVFTSSIAVYGLHGDSDVDEETPLKPYGDPYGDSKIAGEKLLFAVREKTGLPLVVVRPGMVYGPGSQGWTVRMARMARQGLIPLINGGSGTAYPVYVDNLVDLLVLCAARPEAVGEIFNGVDDGPVTLAQFLGGYMKMVPTTRAIRAPAWAAGLGAALLNPFFAGWNVAFLANQLVGRGQVLNAKAKRVLGWSQRVSLEDGLKQSEIWLRAEHII